MSIAEAYDMPLARRPLVPPHPPRAPDDMRTLARVRAMRESAIGSWGQKAYQEDVIKGRLFGRSKRSPQPWVPGLASGLRLFLDRNGCREYTLALRQAGRTVIPSPDPGPIGTRLLAAPGFPPPTR